MLLSASALGGFARADAQEVTVAPAGGQPVNDAVAVNTHDGKSVFKLAFSVRRLSNETVAPMNAAVAYASCTSCRTVAVAIQIVFADSAPTVTPTNVALAINQDCDFCETFAAAYQYVFLDGSEVMLSPDGRLRLTEIRRLLRELGTREDLTVVQLADEVSALASQIEDVLSHELVARGPDADPATTTSSTDTSTSTSSTPSSMDDSPTSSSTSSTGTSTSTTTGTSTTTSSSAPSSTTAP